MPTRLRAGKRSSRSVGGLSESGFVFFGDGPFFEGEDYERETTEAERAATWKAHREEIITRWHAEHPQHADRTTWGEVLVGGIDG